MGNAEGKKVITTHDQCGSCKAALCRYLSLIDWPLLFAPLDCCEDKWKAFHELVHTGLDILMPTKQVCISTADAPWMNQRVKLPLFN